MTVSEGFGPSGGRMLTARLGGAWPCGPRRLDVPHCLLTSSWGRGYG